MDSFVALASSPIHGCPAQLNPSTAIAKRQGCCSSTGQAGGASPRAHIEGTPCATLVEDRESPTLTMDDLPQGEGPGSFRALQRDQCGSTSQVSDS